MKSVAVENERGEVMVGLNIIYQGAFYQRMVFYALLCFPLALLVDLSLFLVFKGFSIPLSLSTQEFFLSLEGFKAFAVCTFPVVIIFFITELYVFGWRRKNGFSFYENIVEELKQREVDEFFMGQINVTIKMDETVKKQAEELFSELGLDMETAFNMFVRQAVNKGGIPFEVVCKDDFHSVHNQEKLKESIASSYSHHVVEDLQ